MSLGREFVGAWQRRSIAIDDGPHEEPARVLWLQAGDAFADLRIPFDPDGTTDAFAGITTYEPPALTWHHTLDWNGGFAGYDCGVVECNCDDMIERGEFMRDGATLAYEERWCRVDRGARGVVLIATHAMIVNVGQHCLAMRDRRRAGGEFDVRHMQFDGAEWNDVTVIGDGAELPRLPVAPRDEWTVGSAVTLIGTEWRVAERWGG